MRMDRRRYQLYGITDDYRGGKGPLRKMFEDIVIYDKLEFLTQHETFRLAVGGQLSVPIPGSHEGFKNILKNVSPDEAEAIDWYQELCDKLNDEFYDMFNAVAHNEPFSRERFPVIYEYGPMIVGDLLRKTFKHPLIIAAYSTYYGYLGIPTDVCPLINLALCYARGEGTSYVKGGSAMMSGAIRDEFIKLGGTVKLGHRVTKILVEDGKVRGVRLDNGEEFYADVVLSNVNKILAYNDLIDAPHVPEQVFDDLRVSNLSQSIFVVYMGLDISAEEAGIVNETSFCRNVSDPTKMFADRFDVNIRNDHLSSVEISCYNVDTPDASPEGTCILSVLASKLPDWFVNCPPEEYFERKDEYLSRVLDFVYQYYPKVKGHIEEIDCATPVTLMRYLGSPNGGVYGMDAHLKDLIANKWEVNSPIKGLYFCGASVFVGGFNNAMMGGYIPPFRPGQFINIDMEINGIRTSRAYTLSSPVTERRFYEVTVKRAPNAFGSAHMLDDLKEGDTVTSSGPSGTFYRLPCVHGKRLVFIAGGSGITPFLSMLKTDEDKLDHSFDIDLIYGSTFEDDIIAKDELDRLEREGFVRVHHIISKPGEDCKYRRGFITGELIREIAGDVSECTFYMCGPNVMYHFVCAELEKLGVPRRAIRQEVEVIPSDPTAFPGWPENVDASSRFTIKLSDGREIKARDRHHHEVLRGRRHCRAKPLPQRRVQHLPHKARLRHGVPPRHGAAAQVGYSLWLHPPLRDLSHKRH